MIADTEDKEEKSVAREGGRGDSTGIERQNLSDNDREYHCWSDIDPMRVRDEYFRDSL